MTMHRPVVAKGQVVHYAKGQWYMGAQAKGQMYIGAQDKGQVVYRCSR